MSDIVLVIVSFRDGSHDVSRHSGKTTPQSKGGFACFQGENLWEQEISFSERFSDGHEDCPYVEGSTTLLRDNFFLQMPLTSDAISC